MTRLLQSFFACFALFSLFFLTYLDAGECDTFVSCQKKLLDYVEKNQESQSILEMERLITHLGDLLPLKDGPKQIFQLADFLEEHDREELVIRLYESFQDCFKDKLSLADRAKLDYQWGKCLLQKKEYSKAEELLSNALKAEQVLHGEKSLEAANAMYFLALLYDRRKDDADYFNKTHGTVIKNMLEPSPEAARMTNPETAIDVNAMLLQMNIQSTREKIRNYYETVLQIYEKHYGTDHLETANVLNNLAVLYNDEKKHEQALVFFNRTLKIREKHYGKESPVLLLCLYNTALVLNEMDRLRDADKILCRAISIFESKDLSGESLGVDLYDLRAKNTTLLWGQEDLHAGATSSLPPFSRILEDRRKAFENSLAADDYTEKSNMVIELIQELKQAREYDEIYDVVNKIRFQRFYDRLKLASTDLLATLPADIAAPLNRQRQELYADCTRLERELVRTLQSDRDQKDYLNTYLRKEALLHEKRKEILALNRKIEDLSPIWRKIKGKRDSERSYQEIKLALTQTETIVLQYLINEKGALSRMTEEITPCHFLLAYGHGLKHPILYSLKIDEKTAKRINELVPEADSAEGYLSTDLLNRLLQNRSKTGLLDRIFAKDDSDATIELSHILWKILVPSVALRKKLTDGLSFRHVLIMPDGPLTKLSFEALVTDPDDRDQCYFLDNGPKISYTFSPAGLGTARKSKAEKYHSLLTLGNANYEQFMRFFDSSASPAKKKDSSFHVFDPRILAGMGKFKALHYSKAEVESIAQLGRERNLQVTSILGNDATEQRFRSSCAGKSIIHLACHGFTDSRWENVFGGLLLTPVDENNEKNDGFLAANEITNMDLRETQLAILSACETNLGEFSHEEGVMSMSRAFMIAGCRNVLTSNWSVDDEATMTLVYHFLDRVLGAAEDNECDLADALRNAKLFLRKFSDLRELKKPFYWAPFVLWGYD